MRKTTRPTLKDVSQKAGVSVGTVSNFLQNPQKVKPANRVVIQNAIDELKFIPNISARNLASGKSRNIALFIVSEDTISPTTWLHQLPMIQTIHNIIQVEGYALSIHIVNAQNEEKMYENVLYVVESGSADVLVFLSVWKLPDRLIEMLEEKEVKYISLDNTSEKFSFNTVFFDNSAAVENLVDVLYDLGHRKIGYISVKSGQQDMKYRQFGFLRGMKKHDLCCTEDTILYGDFSIESGYACVSKLLRTGSDLTAIIAGNDNMAVGAMKALAEVGLSVPQDFSIIGIDNSIAAHASTPVLQTVQFDLKRMGEVAADLIMRLARGGIKERYKIKLGYKIIPGGTIARVPEQKFDANYLL